MPDPSRPLVLSVDDNAAARYARSRVLRNAGFEVLEAGTGGEALDLLAQSPSVVVLDVGLPDVDGLEVCRRIKADPTTASIMVLQVSASFVKGSDQTRALEGGADSFVTEPVEPEVLVATVNALLRIRRAEEAVQRAAREWEATFDAINEGVALLDAAGVVQRCNDSFAGLVGRAADEVLGRSWEVLLDELSRTEHRVDASSVGASMPRTSFRVGPRWVQASSQALDGADHSRGRTVVVLTDVTDHMTALTAAEDANRLKDEFLAVLSHELRTPLNAIVGWAKLLQMGSLGEAETTKALQTISRNAEAQNQLISDILDVSCIVAGKLRLEKRPTDLLAAVDAAIETTKFLAAGKRVRVVTSYQQGIGRVNGDAARLQQVVWNLVSNAIKFAPADGRVDIGVRGDGEHLVLTVEDDGPGVRPEFLPYVFDRFRQADSSSSRAKGGLGLGLAIVKHLVELHGGTVRAENRIDRSGARFTVRLPRWTGSAEPMTAAVDGASVEAGVASLRGVRVLVVDDEEDARSLVFAVLAQHGADVLTAASGMEALPVVERERPDVVVCDIHMAGEDGYTFLRRLRMLPATRGGATPAVALTAYAGGEAAAAAYDAGFQRHVAKPVHPAELVGLVTSLTRTR